MNNNQNADKKADAAPGRFQLSKSLTIRSKVPGRGPANPCKSFLESS